jgi:signal transduction histidine kinase
MPNTRRRAWIPWAIIAFLFLLCGFLAFLQNRWLDEVSRADRQRLKQDLQDELELIRREFDGEIHSAIASLTPTPDEIREMGAQKAVAVRFAARNDAARAIFRSATVAGSSGDGPEFDPDKGRNPALIVAPMPRSHDRLVLELDLDYLRRVTFPELFARGEESGSKPRYAAQVVNGRDVIFRTNPAADFGDSPPDAAVGLLDPHRDDRDGHGLPPDHHRGHAGDLPPGPPARWRLLARYEQGSLDAIVSRARWQNAGMSAGLLVLILATGAFLVSSSRRAHQLAELQFNFVTGVSHELRTPITVIRTAAYNLRGKLAAQPAQVERYGEIIEEESEKLSALVEQVLAFAAVRSGRAIQMRASVAVDRLIEQVLNSSSALRDSGVAVEKRIEPGLPPILADPAALRNAVNNLLDNALKYGTGERKWIGVSASAVGQAVEIRVADRGPGIPDDEQSQIFEPFFRGRSAVSDQVHGTGLGLSLVRGIVEAHGGSAYVESDAGKGTTVVLRLPVTATNNQDGFANPAG